jgi:hypothetical protein
LTPLRARSLVCAQDGKISQLRSLAMKALAEVLQCSRGGAALGGGLRGAVEGRLAAMMGSEKNTVVKAEVAKTQKLLASEP